MNELKPEDVMRALEYCGVGVELRICTKECPYFSIPLDDTEDCCDVLCRDALALLREKDAEIERLTAYNANLICANTDITNRHKDYVEDAERIARADAITEFAERLKKKRLKAVWDGELRKFSGVYLEDIDQIAEELKGENNGSVSESKD